MKKIITTWTIPLDWTARQGLFTWRKTTCVGLRSHLGGMNPFSCKRFVFTKWNTPICRGLTEARSLACSCSRGIWVWFWFSCEIVHYGKDLIAIFRDFLLVLTKFFILAGRAGIGLSFYGVIFPNFLRS